MIRVRKTVALIIAVCLFVTSFAVTSLVAAAVSSKFISGASLNLNNGFSINFYAPVGKLESYDRAVLEVQFRDRGDALQTVELEPGVEQVYFDGEYHKVFSFNNIAPDRFADTVTATIYGVKGVDAPIQLEESFVYSVKHYVENIYEDTTQESNPLFGNRKLKTLLADILVYGEKARDYTGLGADFVMSEWVAENASSGVVANTAESSVKNIEYLPDTVTSSNDEINWTSVGLNLRENAAILYKFKLNARADRVSDYKLVVESNGVVQETVDISADDYNRTEKCYNLYFRGLNPTQMGKAVRAYFINGSGEVVSAALDYSVESFANYCYNNKGALGNELYELTQALVRYGHSAEAYFGENSSGVVASGVTVYPEYDERIERDYTYDVAVVQGMNSYDLTCYNHTDAVATSPRTENGDMYRRFCEFAFTGGPVRVDITVYSDFESYTVMPSAKNFTTTRSGNVISVYLDKPEYFMLKLDASDDSILAVFADAPEIDVPNKGDANVLYIDKWYDSDNDQAGYLINDKAQLVIDQANTTVYLAPGSVLNARIKVNADNVTIKGRGMILDPYSNAKKMDISAVDNSSDCHFLLVEGDYCTIDGIKLIDSRNYNLWVNGKGLKCTNTKILSSRMTTDGITTRLDGGHDISHCFIYVGDNALVLAGIYSESKFTDITIGTICCAIFPQNAAGGTSDYYKLNDIYVFRCDEGLMVNKSNYNSIDQTFNMTLNNVNAVDADHFPWIFYGNNMGAAAKKITFNNLSIPASTGSKDLGSGDGTEIFVTNEKLATNNYTFTFNGLTVGGKAVTSASAIKTSLTEGNTVSVTGNGSSFGPAVAAKKVGAYKPSGKIYIGDRRLDTEHRAVNQSGTWYVPAVEVCEALFKEVPASATVIDGEKYLSLSALVSGGVAKTATYDTAAGRIKITPPAGVSGNLFTMFGNDILSRWAEYTSFEVHMVPLKGYTGDAFRLEECSKNAGLAYNLNPQLQQYGAGSYTLSFKVKADVAANMNVYLTTNRVNQHLTAKALTTAWQEVTINFNYNIAGSSIENAFLMFRPNTDNAGVELYDFSLVYKG